MAVRQRRNRETQFAPRGRSLHLIDIENLAGPDGHIPEALASYRARSHFRPGDHVVIAARPSVVLAAKRAWPSALVRCAHGVDGADLALLAEAPPADLARRFSRVVIGSGDGIFAALAWQLRRRGVVVSVVARPDSTSRALQRATRCVALFEEAA